VLLLGGTPIGCGKAGKRKFFSPGGGKRQNRKTKLSTEIHSLLTTLWKISVGILAVALTETKHLCCPASTQCCRLWMIVSKYPKPGSKVSLAASLAEIKHSCISASTQCSRLWMIVSSYPKPGSKVSLAVPLAETKHSCIPASTQCCRLRVIVSSYPKPSSKVSLITFFSKKVIRIL